MFCCGHRLRRRKDGFKRCPSHGFKPRRIIVYPDGFLAAPVMVSFRFPGDMNPDIRYPFAGLQPIPKNPINPAWILAGWRRLEDAWVLGEIPKEGLADLESSRQHLLAGPDYPGRRTEETDYA